MQFKKENYEKNGYCYQLFIAINFSGLKNVYKFKKKHN